jgi:hypothetical protein
VNGTKSVLGTTATVFTQVDALRPLTSVDYYLAFSGGGITVLGNTDPTDTITPLIVPYVSLTFPVQSGVVSSIVGNNLALETAAGIP